MAGARFQLLTLLALIAAPVLCGGSIAKADPVNATLSAYYFEVGDSANSPDFGGSGSPNVAVGSALGPNGFPVVTSPFGISDVNPGTNEITWWSPALNSAVVATSSPGATISLPYSSNMYAPNSTGSNDGTYFETAYFTGTFTLASPAQVEFQLGSDDDSFIYVDGILLGDNPGIHGVTDVDFTTGTLSAGAHTLAVFYDDRESSGAYLSLNLLSTGVVITPTPEPETLALLGTGLVGLHVFRRRRRRAH